MPISHKATFVLEFQDADTIPSKPLPAARVRVQALDAADRPAATLFDGRANAEGKVILRVLLPATVPGQPTTLLPKVRVTVLDLDGDTLHQVQPDIQPERGKAIPPIQVSDKPQQEKLAMPLGDGNGILGRPLSTTLAKKLKQKKIVSLATLREAGPQAITGLSTQDQQDLVQLAAHAQLQLISRDAAINQKLIAAGYRDVLQITAVPQDVFVKKMEASLGNKAMALRLHMDALAKTAILSNILTEWLTSQSDGRPSLLPASTNGGATAQEPPCHDCGCDSALSPQAYLVDLLDHAVRHVRQNGNVVTSEILTETFLQPFGDLVVGCAASANPVRQVRLCVEVLRQRAHTLGLTTSQPVFRATVDYNARAYNIILRELGTSYRELRSSRMGDPSALAERLGVDQTAIPPIILDPDVLGSRQLSQLNLERLFGLQTERVDQRDPISTGYKFGDDREQIIHWQLDGVEWRRNTDDLGQIHLGLTGASATNFQITLFKSQSRDETNQVAAGKYVEAGKPIQLSPLNGSGLSGYVQVNFVGADDNIYFAAIPEWTAKRLQNLHGQWLEADYPKSEFIAPIVDPDVVDESDFARPFDVDPATDPNLAHKLWIERRNWVKTERTKLDEDATATPPKLTVAKMRERVWPNPTDLANLDALAEDLRGSDAAKVDAAHATLKARGLTPETIGFLYELVSHEVQEAPTDVERAQALDVLVNILKRRDKYSIWRTEEQTIKLAPPFFCLSTVEPTLNPLRATADERASWRAELEKNSTPPIIDPDLIPETFLAANSETIQTLWNSRRALIGDGRRPDDPARVSGTMFDAIAAGIRDTPSLREALKGADLSFGGKVVLHSFGFQDVDLDNMQQALRDGKPLEVNAAQYGLTASELRLLIEVLNLGVAADVSDWSNVHHIQVQAEKRCYLYPAWRDEEQAAGIHLGPDNFRIPADLFTDLLTVFRRLPAFLQWRWNEGSQRGTLEKLKTRLQQQRGVIENVRAAADKAEEECLPVLRDALVGIIVGTLIDSGQITEIGSNSTLEDRKRLVTNRYLIDAFESGCRQTTRVAQAIETLQLLLWGIRSGQVEDKTLTLAPDRYAESTDPAFDFDAEWKWLGSYASWRSAMFIYLYPENLLLPELRRAVDDPDTDPTILFQAVLKVVSGTASPSSSADAEETQSDAPPPPPEDPELQAKIDGILEAIGDADPQAEKSLRKIYFKLHEWRLYGDEISFEQQRNAPASPFYFHYVVSETVRLDGDWWRYKTESSYLEDVLYIPMHFALLQQRQGNFIAALDWFRRVYDFERKPEPLKQGWANPRLEIFFERYGGSDVGYNDLDIWDADNLNPHRIAATRPGVDQRFVLISIIRCLLDYADSEFARDTSESLARARELYETARHLLGSNALGKASQDCQEVIGALVSKIGETRRIPYTVAVLEDLFGRNPTAANQARDERDQLLADLTKVTQLSNPPKPDAQIRKDIIAVVERHLPPPPVETAEQRRKAGITAQEAAFKTLLDQPQVFKRVQRVDSRSGRPTMAFGAVLAVAGPAQFVADRGRWVEAPNFAFCIPRNPLLQMLRLRLESNWFKLHNCMNLAGLYRELPAYAAPTDTSSGLVVAEVSSPTALSAGTRQVPTQYRYKVLIERARQLVNVAQQMEASYLSFLEKRDQEAYSLMAARQDLGLARATVDLQELRVTEADHGRTLAQGQWNRANKASEHYEKLINDDLLQGEAWALGLTWTTMVIQFLIAAGRGAAFVAVGAGADAATFGGTLGTATASSAVLAGVLDQQVHQALVGGLSSWSSALSMLASFERRKQEWEFQKDLAEIDKQIAVLQQDLAEDRYQIVLQEKRIAEMGAENASDVLNFLSTKFTSAELYTWMAGIVGNVYRYFLQEATAIARLAQRQLAFERQERELPVILEDYWTYTDTSALLLRTGGGVERRGMTGSARLLQDITRLDQEAFFTDRRKLQLSKTISLALHDPVAFAQFRETGELHFGTAPEMFDRDFPGHYLRLIKRVRVSVIALVPPTEGIRATLSTNGISRVVTGGSGFAEEAIVREPGRVALTSPINATGLFDLQEQPEMLLPFEGTSVAASWVFSMPRASNPLDYGAIADVLVTIEYTALHSDVYRQQVIGRLNRAVDGARPFSFRQQFADQWYDLHNPDYVESEKQMVVTFETRRGDFPPNAADLRIQRVTLYFSRKDGFTDEIPVELRFLEAGRAGQVGGSASTLNGQISTGNQNAASWQSMLGKQPVGKWELKLPNGTKDLVEQSKKWFTDGQIEDILFVITFSGVSPEWRD